MQPIHPTRLSNTQGRALSRRAVLRGAGIAMSLPWLSAMDRLVASNAASSPQRFVAITLGLGLHQENWKPKQTGKDYEPSLYLRNMMDLRNDMTIISGSS